VFEVVEEAKRMAVQDEVPKSRLTLTYKTEVNGEPETVNLPLRLLVLGDLSQGTSADRKVEFEERRTRNLDGKNLAGVMRDMKMSLELKVANKVDPDRAGEEVDAKLPITGIKSFSPDEVAKNMPKLRGFQLLKKLLMEVDSNFTNTKDFRKLLADLYANEEAYNKVKEQLQGFDSFTLPTSKGA